MKWDCPHCSKLSLRTFCEHCGKPTESLLKYRILYLIGILIIPIVTYFFHTEFQRVLPELESNTANLFQLVWIPMLGFAGLSILFLIWQWIKIEAEFYEYNKKKNIKS